MTWLHHLFDRFGALIVFANALLHELAVPLPLTPTLLVAGAASHHWSSLAVLVAAVAAGSLIGNAVWFAAGRRFGPTVFGWLCRFSLSPDSCVRQSSDRLERWGGMLFIVGRFVPGVFLIVPPVAGALGMRWSRFIALTVAGAAFWALVVVALGSALEQAVTAAIAALERAPAGFWATGCALLAAYVSWRAARRMRARRVARRKIG